MNEINEANVIQMKCRVHENAAHFWEDRKYEQDVAETMRIVNSRSAHTATRSVKPLAIPADAAQPKKKRRILRRVIRFLVKRMHRRELFGCILGMAWTVMWICIRIERYTPAIIAFFIGAVALCISGFQDN